jgi:hypothetical protein
MKAMNMNAVRSSHYPPDTHFLDAADELGLYVIDELPGWQAGYETTIGETLVREMVIRDVHHPSVIFWANGNEGGRNPELDDDFARHDLQRRPVISPYATLGGVFCEHYPEGGWSRPEAVRPPDARRRTASSSPPPASRQPSARRQGHWSRSAPAAARSRSATAPCSSARTSAGGSASSSTARTETRTSCAPASAATSRN